MERVRRVLVHVCREGSAPQCARFVQSVTGEFSEEEEVDVSCRLEENRFLLSRGESRVPLRRPAFCPIKHLSVTDAAALPLDIQQRGVDVGVAVLLQTANQRVLLTRRAAGLRIFPNVWVPPGGHIEPDETMLGAGLRELQEETGLKLEAEEVSPQLLGLWESVYPAMLSRGLPQRHHIVSYMLLHSPHTDTQLQASLRPAPAEVSGVLWADAHLARAVVSMLDGEEEAAMTPQLLEGLPASFRVSDVWSDGSLSDSELARDVLLSRAPTHGPDHERISTGTKFCLKLWIRSLDSPKTV